MQQNKKTDTMVGELFAYAYFWYHEYGEIVEGKQGKLE